MSRAARHIDILDYIRGIAIISVFLFHALASSFGPSTLPWDGWFRDFHVSKSFLVLLPLHLGWAGVPIFFVVSGFCIHMSFQGGGQKWGKFFTRRFFRLYPPYLLAFLLFALVIPSTRLIFSHEPHHDTSSQIINHLLLIHNFDAATFYGVNPAFWSIAVEVQLYLLYPVLLLMVKKFGWHRSMLFVGACEVLIHIIDGTITSMIVAIASFGFRFPHAVFQLMPVIHWLEASPFAYWFSWSIGAYVAEAFLAGKSLPLVKSSIPLWTLLILVSYFVKPMGAFFFLFVALLTATSISKLLSGARPNIPMPSFILAHLRQTGVWSYSIYLLHQPLVGIVATIPALLFPQTHIEPLFKFFCCIISWLVIMPIGGFWYWACESPSIACGKILIRKYTICKEVSPAV